MLILDPLYMQMVTEAGLEILSVYQQTDFIYETNVSSWARFP